jgi:kynureninase
MGRLRDKSIALTGLLAASHRNIVAGSGGHRHAGAASERGCQLSLRHRAPPAAAKRCHDLLTAAGVVADWREPDVLRLAPIPLYNSYSDVFAAAADALAQALQR